MYINPKGMIDDLTQRGRTRHRAPALLLLAICCQGLVFGQGTGTLRFLVDPGNTFEFIVDSKHRMQQREITLGEGLHHFSVWAPERMVVDTSVFVVAGRSSDLVMRLPYSPEFIAHRAELSRWQARRRVERTLPILATAGGAIWTGVALGRYARAKEVLEKDREQYAIDVDPASIRQLKETTIPAHNDDLREARGAVFLAAGVTALSGAATWYLIRRSLRRQRPLFEDRQRVVFDGLVWMPARLGGGVHAGITIPLRP